MSISIQTNVASLNAQYYVSQNKQFQNTAIQQFIFRLQDQLFR